MTTSDAYGRFLGAAIDLQQVLLRVDPNIKTKPEIDALYADVSRAVRSLLLLIGDHDGNEKSSNLSIKSENK